MTTTPETAPTMARSVRPGQRVLVSTHPVKILTVASVTPTPGGLCEVTIAYREATRPVTVRGERDLPVVVL